jgi:hypothetical protein
MTADWSRKFDEPIPLPSRRAKGARQGRHLVTLKDAGTYITKLPKAEHTAPEWQAAMKALILVATTGGPTMLARIGIMRALNRHAESQLETSGKKTQAGTRPLTLSSRDAATVDPGCVSCLSRRRSLKPGGGFSFLKAVEMKTAKQEPRKSRRARNPFAPAERRPCRGYASGRGSAPRSGQRPTR